MSATRPLRAASDERESRFGVRAATVVSLVGVIVGVLWWAPATVFNVGVAAVVVLTVRELYLLPIVSVNSRVYRAAGLVCAALVCAQMLVLPAVTFGVSMPLVVVVLLSTAVVATRRPRPEEFQELLFVVFGVLYVAGTLGQLILIRNLRLGRELVIALVVTVLAREAGAHAGGSLFPRQRPVNGSLNPRKGVAGGVVGVAAACATLVVLSRYLNIGFTVSRGVVFATSVGAACQFGDLAESYIKRVAGRRHSGRALGPEGGLLDFVDAAAFATATAHPLLLWWGY